MTFGDLFQDSGVVGDSFSSGGEWQGTPGGHLLPHSAEPLPSAVASQHGAPLRPHALRPTPYATHHTLYTTHHTPFTLYHTPFTLYHKRSTIHVFDIKDEAHVGASLRKENSFPDAGMVAIELPPKGTFWGGGSFPEPCAEEVVLTFPRWCYPSSGGRAINRPNSP